MNLSHRILCRETSAAGDTYRITHGHTLDDDKDDAGIGRVLFDLVVHLRPHAAGDRQREAIGDDVENLRSVASLFQKMAARLKTQLASCRQLEQWIICQSIGSGRMRFDSIRCMRAMLSEKTGQQHPSRSSPSCEPTQVLGKSMQQHRGMYP